MKWKLAIVGLLCAAPLFALAGYGQGGYYSQGGYYGQSYYQTYYQGSYTAQQIVNMRSTVDQCGQRNNPSLLTCNNFDDWSNPPNTLGTALVPGTAGAFVMRATSGANATAVSSFCRAWGKMNSTSAAWTPQTCADGPNGGSLPAIAAGAQVTLEYWNRARANIGYWNNCSWVCGDHMDWYFQNWLPNCSTNYGGSNGALTTLSGQTAQGYSLVNVNPVVTTTYTVSCSGGDPGNLSRSITVNVLVSPTLTFSANPTAVDYNTASTLSWSTTLVHGCTLSGGTWGGGTGVAANNAGISTGNLTAVSTMYTLNCLRDTDNSVISGSATVTADQCSNIAGQQSGAPANATMAGGICTCDSGYTLSGGSCVLGTNATVTANAPTTFLENSGGSSYTITLSQAAPVGGVTVNFAMSGTAANGVKYNTITSPVTIAQGATTKIVTLTPINNATLDGPQTVIMTINNGAGYTVGVPSSATMTIDDDEIPPNPTINGSGLQVHCTASASPAATCKIRKGTGAYLEWSVSNLSNGQNCAITSNPTISGLPSQAGSGSGISWNSPAGGYLTPAIASKTIFTLTCTGLSPSSVTVNMVPVTIEQ